MMNIISERDVQFVYFQKDFKESRTKKNVLEHVFSLKNFPLNLALKKRMRTTHSPVSHIIINLTSLSYKSIIDSESHQPNLTQLDYQS